MFLIVTKINEIESGGGLRRQIYYQFHRTTPLFTFLLRATYEDDADDHEKIERHSIKLGHTRHKITT